MVSCIWCGRTESLSAQTLWSQIQKTGPDRYQGQIRSKGQKMLRLCQCAFVLGWWQKMLNFSQNSWPYTGILLSGGSKSISMAPPVSWAGLRTRQGDSSHIWTTSLNVEKEMILGLTGSFPAARMLIPPPPWSGKSLITTHALGSNSRKNDFPYPLCSTAIIAVTKVCCYYWAKSPLNSMSGSQVYLFLWL